MREIGNKRHYWRFSSALHGVRLQLHAFLFCSLFLVQGINKIMNTKRIENIEQLKEISDAYTSPCNQCNTDEGCPSMAMCKVYHEYKKKCKTINKDFTGETHGKNCETPQ